VKNPDFRLGLITGSARRLLRFDAIRQPRGLPEPEIIAAHAVLGLEMADDGSTADLRRNSRLICGVPPSRLPERNTQTCNRAACCGRDIPCRRGCARWCCRRAPPCPESPWPACGRHMDYRDSAFTRQRRAIEHQPILEELLATEVLVIGVLDPALAQHLIARSWA